MRTKKMMPQYPGEDYVEQEKNKARALPCENDEPDFIGGAPNYEKFKGWSPEQVLTWLNID